MRTFAFVFVAFLVCLSILSHVHFFYLGFYGLPRFLFHSEFQSIVRWDEKGRFLRKNTITCKQKLAFLGLGLNPQQWDDKRFTALKGQQAMLIRYPLHSNGQYRKLLSRIERLYKMADKQSLWQKYFFGTTLPHAHAHYICSVCAKYQKASVKALVQVDFL